MKLNKSSKKISFIFIMLVISLTLFLVNKNIIVKAEEINSTKLTSLEVEGYEDDLNPTFDKDTLEYSIDIMSNEIDLNINYVAESEGANVEIKGNKYIKNDTGVIVVTVSNQNAEDTIYKINYNKTITKQNYKYTGNYQTFTSPTTGVYKLEVWGAKGGEDDLTLLGGKGGYSVGKLSLKKGNKLYVYVGGQGTSSKGLTAGGYNGGGASSYNTGYNTPSGGGATDIRLVSGNFDNSKSLLSRFIVAGGGGSASYNGTDKGQGGDGGGESGINGITSAANAKNYANPGTQTTGGSISNKSGVSACNNFKSGSFGLGGYPTSSNTCYAGAGGGGWYGGAWGVYGATGGGGGSGFVLTQNTKKNTPTNYSVTSDYYLSDAKTIAGNKKMPTYDGTSTMIGNSGNGYAVITPIANSDDNYLAELTSDYGKLSPAFDPTIEEYTLTIDKYASKFTLSGILSNKNASIIGLGKYEIKNGETKDIEIVVTGEGGSVKTYRIKTIRETLTESEHTSKLSTLEIEGYELSHDFYSLTSEYNLELLSSEMDVNVIAEALDKEATVVVTGNKYMTEDSGVIIVTVTEPHSEDTVYKINYTKKARKSEYIFDYVGDYQTFETPANGTYKLEVWGAQGGDYDTTMLGGKGGYSTGKLSLKKGNKLYVYVGGQGTNSKGLTAGGYNGGGASSYRKDYNTPSGGGATDIRLIPGNFDNSDSLLSRFIVAGGGGSASYNGTSKGQGGAGGGESGTKGTTTGLSNFYGNPGTQTTGGVTSNTSGIPSCSNFKSGTFGLGGYPTEGNIAFAGAGGGGWYGGAWGIYSATGGGGGSGFVLTQNTKKNTPTNYSVTDDYYLSDAKTISGNLKMPSHDAMNSISGNSGNGYAKITPISLLSEDNYLSKLTSNKGTLSPTFDPSIDKYTLTLSKYDSLFVLSGITSDEKSTVIGLDKYEINNGETKNIEIVVTSEFGEIRTYTITVIREKFEENEHTSKLSKLEIEDYEYSLNPEFDSLSTEYNLDISSNELDLNIVAETFDEEANVVVTGNKYMTEDSGVITITVTEPHSEDTIYKVNYTKIELKSEYDFNYTGDYQIFKIPVAGRYKLEVWGAQGGNYNSTYVGGKGGYSVGILDINKASNLYIYVGGAGKKGPKGTGNIPGGYNGGGSSSLRTDYEYTSGGGATDIRLIPGNFDNLRSLLSRFIVAGGGGSGSFNGDVYGYGGAGGGESGIKGTTTQTTSATGAPGTQTSGGITTYWNQDDVYEYYNFVNGSFGLGGYPILGNLTRAGAGGGGWYGGAYGGCWAVGGGGGSGFVLTENTKKNTPLNYLVTNEYYLSDAKTIAGNQKIPTHDGTSTMTGNAGNGYVKITPLTPLSDDNYLTELTSDYGQLSPTFDPNIEKYTLILDKNISKFTLSGTLSDTSAKVSGLNSYSINEGETKIIDILVTSESGKVRTYQVVVTKSDIVHSSKLINLEVEGYENDLNPTFDKDTLEYNINVLSTEIDLNIMYQTEDDTASVTIDGNKYIKNDTGVITITVTELHSEDTIYKVNYTKIKMSKEYNFDYTGSEQSFIAPITGNYKIELWGAQGNNTSQDRARGGKGAYTTGKIKLEKNQKLYVYVGQHRIDRLASFNAGSVGGSNTNGIKFTAQNGYGGGGATDIRLTNGTWTDSKSLASRIMVAAGGGGGSDYSYVANGGSGGSLTGSTGINGKCPTTSCVKNVLPTGGTQTTGGTAGKGAMGNGESGTFGKGGNANSNFGSAGGGGYYGGAGGGYSSYSVDSGAGGSSYISGYLGCVAIKSQTSIIPKDRCSNGTNDISCSYHYSGLIFTDAVMKSGDEEMPTHDKADMMVGNEGSGYAKITPIPISSDNYLKSLNSSVGTISPDFDPLIQEYQLNLDKYTTEFELLGELSDSSSTAVGFGKYEMNSDESKNIEVIVTSKSGSVRIYTVKVVREKFEENEHSSKLSKLQIEKYNLSLNPTFNSLTYNYELDIPLNELELDITTETFDEEAIVKIEGNTRITELSGKVTITVTEPHTEDTIYIINYTKKVLGDTNSYEYTGDYQVFSAPYTGKYKIELWGAQGNNVSTKKKIGGKGSYTSGIINLQKNEKLYIYIGQHRTDHESSFNAGSTGGVLGTTMDDPNINGYGGGGATDIRLISGSWDIQKGLVSRIMVAAGGGGASDFSSPAAGGSGGSLIGISGINGRDASNGGVASTTPPTGGTQTFGGKSSIFSVSYNVGFDGTFGKGGNGNINYGSGGGGGYYGGAGGGYTSWSVDSGAGGSSYISGYLGCVAITSESDVTPKEGCSDDTDDITCSYHYSGLKFTDAVMKSGNEEMPTHDGTSTMIGNEGNGYAKITPLLLNKDNYLTDLKVSKEGNNYSLNPEFESETEEYKVKVGPEDYKITVEATLSNELSEVEGLGEKEVAPGINEYNIIVTSENGDIRNYKLTVERDASSNTNIKNMTPSEGTLTPAFNNSENEYTLEVEQDVTTVDIEVELESEKATITGNKNITLDVNKKDVEITVTAEDGSMRTITLNIIKKASIEDISIEKNNIVIVEGENKKINIETVPAGIETKYIYETENNDVVKIDENGLVTGLKEGTANIVVYPEIDSTIKKNIVVQVLSKTINSETYKIVREEDKYIIGMEERTTISEFISNIENDSSTLKIYNKDLVEELDYTSVVKTGQIIKLIINGKEYDELISIVRGDINGDGEVNVTDKTIIKNHILSKEEITDYRKYAADVVEDNEINVSDNTKLGNYVLGKITTLN